MSTKPYKISAGRGWRWRSPGEIVREGDQMVVWNADLSSPVSQTLGYRMVGKQVRETGFFIRCRQARPAEETTISPPPVRREPVL